MIEYYAGIGSRETPIPIMIQMMALAITGGTGQALRLAHANEIPVYNLATYQSEEIVQKVLAQY
jgi:hypothetical protein